MRALYPYPDPDKQYPDPTKRTYTVYIALFVYLATKAIYIELVKNLSSNFLQTLRRFIGRRGKPSPIFNNNELEKNFSDERNIR